MIAAISKGLRRQLCVIAVNGMAVTMEPIAYKVTNWPINDSDTRRSALICGSKPAGMASVRMVMKAAMASASRPAMGRRSEEEGGAALSASVSERLVMRSAIE